MAEMTLEDKEKRYAWLTSQERWHARRTGKWHRNQARWYRKQSLHVFTFSDIVVRTFRKHRVAMGKNIATMNAIWSGHQALYG